MRVASAYAGASDAEVEAVTRVLRSGLLANGPEAAHLEEEFARVAGVPHAVAVSSGTDALYVAGRALGIGPGSVVLAAGFSFAATANAFLSLGAAVVPVDVDVTTRNMDAAALRAALAEHPDCAAVVVVDLYGGTAGTPQLFDVAAAVGVPVIEDACQAHGASSIRGEPVGSRAALTAFSLYATKNVSAGEGGLVTTRDDDLAARCRLLRNHGAPSTYRHEIVGLNHRLPEMAAALARLRLAGLADGNRRRLEYARLLAAWCREAWPDAHLPETPADGTHVFHQFTIAFADPHQREGAQQGLREAGVDARVHYPYTLAELPGVTPTSLPSAEWLRDRVLSMPVHPSLTNEQLSVLKGAIAAVGRATAGS